MGFKNILIFILFFLCLVFPLEPLVRVPKYILMIFFTLYCKNLSFFKNKNFFYFICIILFFSCYGYLNSAGDLINNIQVYLIMPFFYSWIILFKDYKVQSIFTFNVVISVILTVLLMVIFQSLDLNHFQLNTIAQTSVRYSYNSITNEFSFPLFNVLPFTLSFIIIYFGKNNWYKGFLILISLLISFYTGRKGVFLGISLVSVLIIFENYNIYLKYIIFLLFSLFSIIFVSMNFSVNDLDYLRFLQYNSLMNMWQENFLIGHGLGAHTDLIRNIQKPSSYELFYLSLLNQIGVIGLLFFVDYFNRFVLFQSSNIFVRSVQYGIIAVLISSFTNPYFDRFDFLFLIFIPFILKNDKQKITS